MWIHTVLIVFSRLLTEEDLKKSESSVEAPRLAFEFVADDEGKGVKMAAEQHEFSLLGDRKTKGHIIPKDPVRSDGIEGAVLYRYHHPLKPGSKFIYVIGGEHKMGLTEAHLPIKKTFSLKKQTSALGSIGYEKQLDEDHTFFIETGLSLPILTEERNLEASYLGIKDTQQKRGVEAPGAVVSVGVTF